MAASQRTSEVRWDGSRLRAGRGWAHGPWMVGVLALLLGCTWILTAGVAHASQTGPATGSAWRVEPTPNPAGATISELSAVSCTSGLACTAVGSHATSLSGPSATLAERWNGTTWRIQHTTLPPTAASGTLFGVSCASATACTAVGSAYNKTTRRTVNLAEAWDGTSWRVQVIPTPQGSTDSSLHGVSCTSWRACTAVGNYDAAGRVFPMAERWNGTTWRLQTVPTPAGNEFFGVSCSAVHACTAVGYHTGTGGTRPVAERWNGKKWRTQAVPLPSGTPGGTLTAVSCSSLRVCTATGGKFSSTAPTLAERWSDMSWSVQRTPSPANFETSRRQVELNGVSCTSATACTASGAYAPGGQTSYFLEAWNGHNWRLVTAPTPTDFAAGALNGTACVLARCTAVGAWSGGAVPVATLAIAS